MVLRGEKVIPPRVVRHTINKLGHLVPAGISSTKRNVRQEFWCPGIDAEVERYVRNCDVCARSDKSAKPCSVPLTPVEPPVGAM